jgi:hypothetical protein
MITKCENRPESGCRACEYSQDRFDCRVNETKQVKHTPGPWKVVGTMWIESAEGRLVSRAVHLAQSNLEKEDAEIALNIANARLIASAPDLLAACKDLSSIIAHIREGERNGGVFGELSISDDKARDAIRKAEGQEEGKD